IHISSTKVPPHRACPLPSHLTVRAYACPMLLSRILLDIFCALFDHVACQQYPELPLHLIFKRENMVVYEGTMEIRPWMGYPRFSHKNFTRLSNASNLLGQSAKSSSAS